MNSNLLFTIVSIVIPIMIAIGGYFEAKKKHRNPWLWCFNCLLSDFLGLIILCCSRTLNYDEELDCAEESDVLGWIMLPVSIMWFAIGFYYGYYGVKSHHDLMILDFMLQTIR